jgi:hypothetical protein
MRKKLLGLAVLLVAGGTASYADTLTLVGPIATHAYQQTTNSPCVIGIFIQGHYFQGLIRLIPVAVFGLLFTLLALWRKSLRPGMIAYGLGDGFLFFIRHL